MGNCVNKNSPEFIALQKQVNIHPIVLAAKVSLWQEVYGLNEFPTAKEIGIKKLYSVQDFFPDSGIISTVDLLNNVAESSHPLFKVALHLQKFSNLLDKSISKLESEESMPDILGTYFPHTHNIDINFNMEFKQGGTTILHEILHAMSYKELHSGTTNAKKFEELYDHAKSFFKEFDWNTYEGTYAIATIDEFMVALYTDAKFIKELQKIPPIDSDKFKSLYEEIIDYILSLLDFDKKEDHSLYTQAFYVAESVLLDASDRKYYEEEFYKSLEEEVPFSVREKNSTTITDTQETDEGDYSIGSDMLQISKVDASIDQKEGFNSYLDSEYAKNKVDFTKDAIAVGLGFTSFQELEKNIPSYLEINYSSTGNPTGLLIKSTEKKLNDKTVLAAANRIIKQMDERVLHPTLLKLGLTTGKAEKTSKGQAYIKFIAPQKAVLAHNDSFSSKSLHPLMVNWRKLSNYLKDSATPTQIRQLDALYVRASLAQESSMVEQTKEEYGEDLSIGMTIEPEGDFSISMPNNSFSTPKFEAYLEKRKQQLKKIEVSLVNLYQTQKTSGKSPTLTKRLTYLKGIKANLEKEMAEFSSKTTLEDKFEYVRQMFLADAALVNELLDNPTPENITLAKDMLEYIGINADPKNGLNKIFRLQEGTEYYPEVLSFFGELSQLKIELEKKYDDISDELILDLLTPYAGTLQKMFPESFIDESKVPLPIREALVKVRDQQLKKAQEDISFIEKTLLPQNHNVFSESDLLAQLCRATYEVEAHKKHAEISLVIDKINAILPELEAEMRKLGKVSTGISDYLNYTSLFYRTNKNNIIEPYLVSKFTFEWEQFVSGINKITSQKIQLAISQNRTADISKAYAEKYKMITEKADFIDPRKLEDLSHGTSSTFIGSFSAAEKAAYKQSIIDRIGLTEYEEIIKDQQNKLDEFEEETAKLTRDFLAQNGGTLTADQKNVLANRISMRDPYFLAQNIESGNMYFVPVTVSGQTYTTNHLSKHNSIIPKKFDRAGKPTDFFDQKFEVIENNPTLKKGWEAFQEATHLINTNLVDSNLSFSKNSILAFKKSIKEEFLNKSWRDLVKDISYRELISNTRHFLLNAVSISKKVRGEDTINLPAGVTSFNEQVKKQHSLNVMQLGNLFKRHFKDGSKIDYSTLSVVDKQNIFDVFGVTDEGEFLSYVDLDSEKKFRLSDLKVFAKKSIAEQQTLDLPTMLKVLLEQSALHSARASTKIKIAPVLNLSSRKTTLTGEKRVNANEKTGFFVDTVVNNGEKLDHFGRLFQREDTTTKEWIEGINLFVENLSYEEKKTYRIYKERLAQLDEMIASYSNLVSNFTDPDLEKNTKILDSLEQEKEYIERSIKLMGKDYAVSAAITNMFTTYQVAKGMAYSWVSPVFNTINARMQLINRDGEFWKPGNAYTALAFVDMRMGTMVSKEYEKQWKILGGLVERMNLISDGSNEFQRGERVGVGKRPSLFGKLDVKGKKIPVFNKKLLTDPYYGTAMAEYYNQIPTFLSMSMDKMITDVNGNEFPLFDGQTFVPYQIAPDNTIELKPEFDTEENRKKFLTFESTDSAVWATQIKNAIDNLNGDYRGSGAIMAKNNVFGKQFLAFKTWTGTFLTGRYAYNQQDLLTGETKDGYITGSMAYKETRAQAISSLVQLLSGSVAFGALTAVGGPAFLATALLGGAAINIGVTWYASKKAMRMAQVAGQMAQPAWKPVITALAQIFRTNTIGMLELPLNMGHSATSLAKKLLLKNSSASTGKLVNPAMMIQNSEKLTPRQMKNLTALVRQTVLTNYTILLTLIAMSLLGDDDEDELKGKEGTLQRKVWEKQQQKKLDKENSPWSKFGLLLKNSAGRFSSELNFGIDPIASFSAFLGDNSTSMGGGLPLMDMIGGMVVSYLKEDSENINTNEESMYYGDSKTSIAIRKNLLPGSIRNIDKEGWKGGFEQLEQEDYFKSLWDQIYNTTDLKKDQKAHAIHKNTSLVEIREEVSQQYLGKSFKEIKDAPTKEKVKKTAEERFENLMNSPKKGYRMYYTEDQERLDTPEAKAFFESFDEAMKKD